MAQLSRSAGLAALLRMTASFLSFTLALAAVGGGALFFSSACGATVATVLSDGDGGTAPEASTVGATCAVASDCNDEPMLSTQRGQCMDGQCVCNAGVARTPAGKCGPPPAATDAGLDCVSHGGVCMSGGRPGGPSKGSCSDSMDWCWVPLATGVSPACATDQDCNEDPAVSALHGTCKLGLCFCNDGFTVQTSGKCAATAPPTCALQGGVCRQSSDFNAVHCDAGELESDQDTNTSCGTGALCCVQESGCKSSGQRFVCSHKGFDTGGFEFLPICANHWDTCRFPDPPRAL